MERSDRKVITRSPSHMVHAVRAGGLLDSYVEAESRLEAHFIRRAALIPSHPKIIHQPFRAPISPKGYTPDFLVFFPGSGFKAIVEVKIAERIDSHYQELFDSAAAFFTPRGFVLFVITEFELKHRDIHQRVKLLMRFAKDRVSDEVHARVTTMLGNYPKGLPLGSLSRKTEVPTRELLALIARGVLTCGPRLQIDPSAVVCLPNTTESDDEVFFCRWFDTQAWDPNARACP